MEKGSFQDFRPEGFIENPRSHSLEQDDVRNIPLPTVVPQKIDFQNLPSHILRSATVDSLLQQNEDLMLRLKVQLRRNSDLEEEVQTLKDNSSDIIYEVDRLRDELLIYREKDKLFSARNVTSQSEVEVLKNKIKFLETQYAELYSASKEKQHQLLSQTQNISRFKKYRKAIRHVAYELRARLQLSEAENQKQSQINRDLMSKLGEAGERIQYMNRQITEDRTQLVESYERQLSELNEELTSLRTVHTQNEALIEERIEWNNSRVRLERMVQSERENTQKQIRELQETLASYRIDSKERALKIVMLEKEKNELLEEKSHFTSEQQAMIEQVESLQVLWRDNQNQIEKMTSQIESLQKLNQQLSQQVNQFRKENMDIRNKTESSSFKDAERIRELSTQVQLMAAKKYKSLQEQESLEKIEHLLTEIQSGFQVTGSPAQDNSSET